MNLIADSGCTAHFVTPTMPVANKQRATTPITIANPNGTRMQSSHTAELDIPGLPPAARRVHIVPALKNHSLLSVGQLCDAGCEAHFTQSTVTITCDDETVLTGNRTNSKLWHIEPPTKNASVTCDIQNELYKMS
jgi:hypothetical protein